MRNAGEREQQRLRAEIDLNPLTLFRPNKFTSRVKREKLLVMYNSPSKIISGLRMLLNLFTEQACLFMFAAITNAAV
jgi:hypothetical protein